MKLSFQKYSATGNDFILIDDRLSSFDIADRNLWKRICHRKFGVGADGVLILKTSANPDSMYRMQYANGADGEEVAMCGNGARALAYFASKELGISPMGRIFSFDTLCSTYQGLVENELVKVKMTELQDEGLINLEDLIPGAFSYYVDTGVPHALFEIEELDSFPVVEVGKKIRNDKRFPKGTNVNFFKKISENTYGMRTYERGVEDETLACGTGAVALANFHFQKTKGPGKLHINVPGGELTIEFDKNFKDVWLCGKVEKIFEGVIEL